MDALTDLDRAAWDSFLTLATPSPYTHDPAVWVSNKLG